MIEQAYSQPDFRPGRLWRIHRPALAHALGAKIMPNFAAEQVQPIYGDGYMLNQKMIDGFEERACEVRQKRVAAIGKAAGVPFALVVTKAATAYAGIIDARKHHYFANSYARRVMPPRQCGFDIFPFRTGGFHAT